MSFHKALTLNTGQTIPQIGFGTWRSKSHEGESAIEIAVRNGYRHLDFAPIYRNEEEIGHALKKVIPSVVKREELFITSKLWNTAHRPPQVPLALDETLKRLGLQYLDLYLMHWPVAFEPGHDLYPKTSPETGEVLLDMKTSVVDTWKAMIELLRTEKVKSIGVSNFTIPQLEGIIEATGVVPAVNQIEAHPRLPQDELVKYCKEKNIHLTAYSPLGNNIIGVPMLTEHPIVQAVAEKLNATPAQVLIAWGIYRGYSVIPKSVQESRIISNFKQIELNEEDYSKVTCIGADNHKRYNVPIGFHPWWNINVFGEPQEEAAALEVKIL